MLPAGGEFRTRVPTLPAPEPLGAWLARRFPYHDREGWDERIRDGRVKVDGLAANADQALQGGETIGYLATDYSEPEVPADFAPLRVDTRLAFIHKPAGLPVHRTGTIFFTTLVHLVRAHFSDPSWSPLNRLDRETSGIVVFARGPRPLNRYSPAAARWTKLYLAVCRGIPSPTSGTVDQPLGPAPEGNPIRCQAFPRPDGKPARTHYQVVATDARAGLSLLALAPETGRKHQLRAHLAWLGHPVLGDKIYADGGEAFLRLVAGGPGAVDPARAGAPHHLLHAFQLDLEAGPWDRRQCRDWRLPPAMLERFPLRAVEAWAEGGGPGALAALAGQDNAQVTETRSLPRRAPPGAAGQELPHLGLDGVEVG